MSKVFLQVDDWADKHKDDFVRLKKGLKIRLFAVAMGAICTLSGYSYNLRADNAAMDVQLPQTEICIRLESNQDTGIISIQERASLYNSLMEHRGEQMSPSEMVAFHAVASQVQEIGFTDSMVCYDGDDRQVTFDLLTQAGLILHLTQYFEDPTDQIVYSIERDGKFLRAGHLPINGFSSQLSEVLRNTESIS